MTRVALLGKLWRADVRERRFTTRLSESGRRTLAFWAIGLTLLAMTDSIAAWQFVDGYGIDWPLMGIMVATLASMAAILIKLSRPMVHHALNGISVALTFPCAAWVLWRMFA